MQHLTTHNHKRTDRLGHVTVIVLIILLVMSAMIGQHARRVIRDRRQVQQDLLHRQTLELATAGVQRLKQQRQDDPSWSGETWKPTINSSNDQTKEAEVVINVDGLSATVVARYPVNSQFPIQITRQIELEE